MSAVPYCMWSFHFYFSCKQQNINLTEFKRYSELQFPRPPGFFFLTIRDITYITVRAHNYSHCHSYLEQVFHLLLMHGFFFFFFMWEPKELIRALQEHADSTQEDPTWDLNPEPVNCEAEMPTTCSLVPASSAITWKNVLIRSYIVKTAMQRFFSFFASMRNKRKSSSPQCHD